MKSINVTVNAQRNGFHIPSEFNKAKLQEWMKQYKWFKITPSVQESSKQRRYLEGACIPEYCKFQYNIDPTDREMQEARRMLFKRDFNYEIITNRLGEPERIPVSSRGLANDMTQKFVEWATENGCKVPNPALYKKYRDEFSMDMRFPSYHDFLVFLSLDCDAMPSNETLKKLYEKREK